MKVVKLKKLTSFTTNTSMQNIQSNRFWLLQIWVSREVISRIKDKLEREREREREKGEYEKVLTLVGLLQKIGNET
jgi:hypothetical protein